MSFWPVPDVMKDDIYKLSPRMFTNRGIRFIMLDVDNTIAPYTVNEASTRLKGWAEDMKKAGLELFILSNNKGDRPAIFAEELGIDYIKCARKPFTKAAKALLEEKGVELSEAAIIGDQIYTDTLCGKSLGVYTVLVEPILFSNFLLRLRYWAEFPFRLKYKWRYMK